ncbi:MAG: MFS transporter [Deltaproteobacteria bacterium]|nr:MFS transporter [Deltaproteobacteria bacterium]
MPTQTPPSRPRSAWAWALYDTGNSAFATVVMAGFFPIFFKTFWSAGADVTLSTARLGLANSLAGLLMALCAPLLGAAADCGRAKKKYLAVFAAAGIAATAALFLVERGCWPLAAALFVAGSIGFSGGNIFYDALLPGVAGPAELDRLSARGFALGYLGGGLLFAGCIWLTLNPGMCGGAAPAAVRISFVLTAIWWAVFTVPLLLWVPEPGRCSPASRPLRSALAELRRTLHTIRRIKPAWMFLLAYWCYIDGVDTIIRMAVDYGLALGLAANDLILALLITQFVGFPCALLFGQLGRRWGAKKALYLAIGGYLGIVLWGMVMTNKTEFYLLAAMVGLVQGGIQALSRSYFARLIPPGREAQFFGFYNMVGKYAVIFGPALMGLTGYFFQSSRAGIASIALFFILGAFLLSRVQEKSQAP